VTNNVTAKPAAFLHETNHGCTVVSYMCSCRTLIVSRQWPFEQYTTQGRISNRGN